MKKIALIPLALLLSHTLFSQSFEEQTGISLPGVREGSVTWGDYDNDGDLDLLITGTTDGSPSGAISKIYRNDGNSIFIEQTGITLKGTYRGSSEFGDYNNDGYLDILLIGFNGSQLFSVIYQNNKDGTFTEQTAISLRGVYLGDAALGDYNNDGALDILLSGTDESGAPISTIYRNNENNTFTEQINIQLEPVTGSSVIWFDYNNDAYNDIALTGVSNSGQFSKIYRNNGDNSFSEQTSIQLTGMYYGSIEAGDFDNDGYTDLLIAGASLCKIYHNNGNGTFTELENNSFPGMIYGSLTTGDYDNDGDLDFIITGSPDGGSSNLFSKIFRNDGLNTFAEQTDVSLPGVYYSSVSLADYDNDGDLDIFLCGSTGTEIISRIYENLTSTTNTKPTAVTSFISPEINGAQVTLKWNHATDAQTPWKGLTYNVKLGTSPKDSDIVNPQSLASGKRKIVAKGNAQSDTMIILKNLKKDNYLWRVQTLDNSFTGGEFSAEQIFTITAENQASDINKSKAEGGTMTIRWNRGNGDKCLVFIREGNSGTVSLSNGTTYSADPKFGSGSLVDDWYCVYDGIDNEVKVTNLKPLTDYIFQVVEYEGDPGSELYYSASGLNNPMVFKTTFITEQTGISLPGTYDNNIAFGDYDNNGSLDILLTGSVYSNNGDNTFTNLTDFEIGLTGSGAWGDYDNDGYLDILIAGFASSGRVAKIFRNNRDSTFTEQTSIALTGVGQCSVTWGDYDNDGDLDILMTGSTTSTNITRIYRNNGPAVAGFTEQVGISLTGVNNGIALWGDYDNDGSLDILVSGSSVTKIYHNNKDNTFTELTGISLTGYSSVSAAWGDYDNDGDLDILISGSSTNGFKSEIYRNDGNNIFSQQSQLIVEASNGSVAWGDINNDGYLDFIVTGRTSSGFVSKIYKNNTDNTFTELTDISLDQVQRSSVTFGDYDNDNDLDFILNGWGTGTNIITKIYLNEINVSNKLPDAPGGLTSILNGTQLNLSWETVNNDETPSNALTYNVRIGRVSGENQIVPSHSSTSGFRRVVAMGNAGEHLTYQVNNIYPGTYYWSVQAVDNSLKGGPFSTEQQVDVDSIQAHNLNASPFNSTSLLIRWQRGNGTRCIVFCKAGPIDVARPAHNSTYIAETTFGNGDEISGGWYCIYNGKNDSVIINGLIPNTQYTVAVIEYMGSSGNEKYFREIRNDNGGSFGTGIFTEQSGMNLPGMFFSSAVWADYDNDGYLDFIISGMDNSYSLRTKIFRNNGNNTFSDQPEIIPEQIYNGKITWGDYDNDGYLDLLITGSTGWTTTKIYHNNHNNTFSELSGSGLPGVRDGSSGWVDYDNDGFLDIFLSGEGSSGQKLTKIYHNNGDSTFNKQEGIALPETTASTFEWGDYDNDGYLDFFLSGLASTGYISKIYHNNGNSTFIQMSDIPITGVMYGSAAWGDYDGDGDMDLLISGAGNDRVTKIYRNDNGITFTEQANLHFTSVEYSSVAWGDYDDDGDLDILVTGESNTGPISKIYRNNNDNTFTEQTGISLTGIHYGSVAWADYDNDGDLDLLLSGSDKTDNPVTKIYRNNTVMKTGNYQENLPPSKPANLKSQFFPDKVLLNWSPVTTDETNYKAMTYNLRVGTVKDSIDVCPPNSDTLGFRRIITMGNAQLDTTFLINNLPSGKYYWNVQAIDQGYKGGEWSVSDSFTVKTLQAFYSATNVCKGYATSFTDQSVATDPIQSWLWDFKDGQSSPLQNPEHTFASAGTYKVRLVVSTTNTKDTLEQDVIVKPKPVPGFTAPAVCVGAATSFTNTTNENGLPISQWAWNFGDGQGSASQSPGTHLYSFANTYPVKLQVLASNGCSDSTIQNVIVASYPNAVVSAIGALSFCVGDSVSLSVPNQAGCTYQWKNGSIDIQEAVSNKLTIKNTSGTYKAVVTTTSAGCVSNTIDPVIIAVNQPPASPYISNSGSINFCQGDSVILSVTNTSGYTYQWKLNGGAVGANQNSFIVKLSGTYTLVVANSLGCSVNSTNTVNVVVNPKPTVPTVNVNGNTTFCAGGSVQMGVTNDPALTYQWMNGTNPISGSTSNSYTVSATGNYKLNITNLSGCASQTQMVAVNVLTVPVSPVISAGGLTTFCQGDSVFLSVTNIPSTTYQWKLNGGAIGLNQFNLSAKTSGTYSLQLTNSSGCSVVSTNTIQVTSNSKPAVPSVNINGATDFCQGSNVVLSVVNNPTNTYQWMNTGNNISGATTNSYTATNSGKYVLKVTNTDGCSILTQDVIVSVAQTPSSPTINASGPVTFCQGDSVMLSVSNNPAYTYHWKLNGGDVGLNSNEYKAKAAGIYTLLVTNAAGCSNTSTSPVSVTVKNLPSFSSIGLSGPTEFCEGENLTLSVSATAGYTYRWDNAIGAIAGATSTSYLVTASGTYRLAVTNQEGCELRSSPVQVNVKPNPAMPVITTENYIANQCLGENPIVLKVDPVSGYTYQWMKNGAIIPGATQSHYEGFLQSGSYSVSVDNNGCKDDATQPISLAAGPAKPTIITQGPKVWYLACSDTTATLYKWYYNGQLINGANNYLYVANQKLGTYTVSISSGQGCFAGSDPVTIPLGTTGISEEDIFSSLKIYPNPTPGLFTIEMNNQVYGELNISIFTEVGRKILNIKFEKTTQFFSSQIDLSGQPEGTYLIKLLIDKYEASRKLIVD